MTSSDEEFAIAIATENWRWLNANDIPAKRSNEGGNTIATLLVHGRIVASRIGPVPAVAAVVAASTPFALIAALTGNVVVAVAALAVRAMFMYGTQATWSAYQLSSFTPAERAAANASLALVWNVAAALASSASGAIRGALGPAGFTVNLVVLIACYLAAAALQFMLFRGREPKGDVVAVDAELRAAWPTNAD